MRSLSGLAIVLLASAPPGGVAPVLRETTTFYDVAGQTAEQLRDAMNRTRPMGLDGKRSDAVASWKVHYTYQTTSDGATCRLRRLTVTADISTTLPRWVDRPTVATPLTERWEKHLAALNSSMAGIQDIGRRAATSLNESLWKLPQQARCEALDDLIGTTADAVIQQHLRENDEYGKSLQDDPAKAARFP